MDVQPISAVPSNRDVIERLQADRQRVADQQAQTDKVEAQHEDDARQAQKVETQREDDARQAQKVQDEKRLEQQDLDRVQAQKLQDNRLQASRDQAQSEQDRIDRVDISQAAIQQYRQSVAPPANDLVVTDADASNIDLAVSANASL